MTDAELRAWVDSVGLSVGEDAWERLDRLMELWRQYGRAINLLGATDRSSLLEHVQEGLQCVACVEETTELSPECCWVDVGSGGGLPGLVVAAVRRCDVVLVEPRERRAAFLDLALASVGVGRGRVIRARWSGSTWNQVATIEPKSRDATKFYVLSSRAVFAPEIWLEEASKATISRGMVLCHVESGVSRVGEKRPSTIVQGSRWSVLGFSANSGG